MKDAAILTGCSRQRRSEPAGSGNFRSTARRIGSSVIFAAY